jgi:SAM-dependent methyltransferase
VPRHVPRRVKRYDRAYFERWYHDPTTRVVSRAAIARKARFALGAAEHLLGRRVRTVLDVGCGEGEWGVALRRLRPGIRYTGVDGSEYAVRRFGARRNLRLGTVGTLGALRLATPRFDLVVCSDVLHYVPTDELARGVPALASLVGGVAYIELFTSADEIEGDLRGFLARPPSFYRKLFTRAGLAPRGLHCWVVRELAGEGGALERG